VGNIARLDQSYQVRRYDLCRSQVACFEPAPSAAHGSGGSDGVDTHLLVQAAVVLNGGFDRRPDAIFVGHIGGHRDALPPSLGDNLRGLFTGSAVE
jgi:hypothetical protein